MGFSIVEKRNRLHRMRRKRTNMYPAPACHYRICESPPPGIAEFPFSRLWFAVSSSQGRQMLFVVIMCMDPLALFRHAEQHGHRDGDAQRQSYPIGVADCKRKQHRCASAWKGEGKEGARANAQPCADVAHRFFCHVRERWVPCTSWWGAGQSGIPSDALRHALQLLPQGRPVEPLP